MKLSWVQNKTELILIKIDWFKNSTFVIVYYFEFLLSNNPGAILIHLKLYFSDAGRKFRFNQDDKRLSESREGPRDHSVPVDSAQKPDLSGFCSRFKTKYWSGLTGKEYFCFVHTYLIANSNEQKFSKAQLHVYQIFSHFQQESIVY